MPMRLLLRTTFREPMLRRWRAPVALLMLLLMPLGLVQRAASGFCLRPASTALPAHVPAWNDDARSGTIAAASASHAEVSRAAVEPVHVHAGGLPEFAGPPVGSCDLAVLAVPVPPTSERAGASRLVGAHSSLPFHAAPPPSPPPRLS